ncbi:hypothetical protein TBR22_A17970 [Luteitalea sp. TBR-22]|uniref:sensor histidine kinase n=1 Tax=Luteitalea sp. TBR-22 TaxID=2802971 RepID=UPI001AFBFB97|nr:HAMP domain-containing sensor histidine kinase [Luteitalea sp. TBR-22]BCS32583.1 hypothetical protein TBR22_A17970 [Luteitalea sp. TBR-22]
MGKLHALLPTLAVTAPLHPDQHSPVRERAREHAEEVSPGQEAFAAALAHELTQPLAALILNAEAARVLATRLPATADQGGALADTLVDIEREAARAATVIDGLRALFSGERLTAGRATVNDALRAAIAEVAVAMDECGVRAHLALTEPLPDVCGQQTLLYLMFLNLMVNAIQAMAATPPGERELYVGSRQDGDRILVTVADTGCGFPAALRSRIFDRGVSTKTGHLGVGLALVKRIADVHGGRLDVDASARRGTAFVIAFPPAATMPSCATAIRTGARGTP